MIQIHFVLEVRKENEETEGQENAKLKNKHRRERTNLINPPYTAMTTVVNSMNVQVFLSYMCTLTLPFCVRTDGAPTPHFAHIRPFHSHSRRLHRHLPLRRFHLPPCCWSCSCYYLECPALLAFYGSRKSNVLKPPGIVETRTNTTACNVCKVVRMCIYSVCRDVYIHKYITARVIHSFLWAYT